MSEKVHICLNMIVKNESDVILRCLNSLLGLIDSWLICDTGSTDGTQALINGFFEEHNIDGALIEHEWKDFAFNRNVALDKAKELLQPDYILMMDADDVFHSPSNFEFKHLKADEYLLHIKRNGIDYSFPKLIRSALPWKWQGVLHEYLECDSAKQKAVLKGDYYIQSTSEGSRGLDPDKYKKDIAVLQQGLIDEPNNARYQFYLAQSFRDNADYAAALEHYQKRAEMLGWEEEVYYSLLEVARCQHLLEQDAALVIESYLKAYNYRSSRLEALYEAIRICRIGGMYNLGYRIAQF